MPNWNTRSDSKVEDQLDLLIAFQNPSSSRNVWSQFKFLYLECMWLMANNNHSDKEKEIFGTLDIWSILGVFKT
jgi:hypothetical protein